MSRAVFRLGARLDGERQWDRRGGRIRGVGRARRASHLGFHLRVPPHGAPFDLHEERKVVRSPAAARPLLDAVVEDGRAGVVAAASRGVAVEGVVDGVAADALADVHAVGAGRRRQRAPVHVRDLAIGRRLHASRREKRSNPRLGPSKVRVLGRRRARRMRVRQHLHEVSAPHRALGHHRARWSRRAQLVNADDVGFGNMILYRVLRFGI